MDTSRIPHYIGIVVIVILVFGGLSHFGILPHVAFYYDGGGSTPTTARFYSNGDNVPPDWHVRHY